MINNYLYYNAPFIYDIITDVMIISLTYYCIKEVIINGIIKTLVPKFRKEKKNYDNYKEWKNRNERRRGA